MSEEKMTTNQCIARDRDWVRCTNDSVEGGNKCKYHHPQKVKERAQKAQVSYQARAEASAKRRLEREQELSEFRARVHQAREEKEREYEEFRASYRAIEQARAQSYRRERGNMKRPWLVTELVFKLMYRIYRLELEQVQLDTNLI